VRGEGHPPSTKALADKSGFVLNYAGTGSPPEYRRASPGKQGKAHRKVKNIIPLGKR